MIPLNRLRAALPAQAALSVPETPTLVRAPLDELAGGLAHDGVNPGESAAITRWMTWSESQLPYDVDVTVDDSEFIEP